MKKDKKIREVCRIRNLLLAIGVLIAVSTAVIYSKIPPALSNVLLILLETDLIVLLGFIIYIRKQKKEEAVDIEANQLTQNGRAVRAGPVLFGKSHHIGRRREQQDSFGKAEAVQGQMVLAVVADGMGGLSGSDQVSRRIVMGMLSYAAQLKSMQMDGILQQMVATVNEEVNRMLGPDGLYQSGSTLLAVLADKDKFQWIAVGDSRIYLYRRGSMLQLNHEHTILQEWMPDILAGELSYNEAVHNPESRKLTSFIGMGKLKYVDVSLRSIPVVPGDRILLMSDGVFNALSDDEMAAILKQYEDVQQAANVFEQRILAAQIPGQDNFTVAILGY